MPHPAALVRPPRLRTDDDEAGASSLELFFDVAYVWVVYELAQAFLGNLTWAGLGVLIGLYSAVWFSWVGYTLYANRFAADDIVFRLAKLVATGAIAGCAASAGGAGGDQAVPFAICYAVGMAVLTLLHVRAWRHIPQARPTISVYVATNGLSALLWIASIPASGVARPVLWAAGVLVGVIGPAIATLRGRTIPLHVEHLPERFGLLVMLVLGESVGGVARGLHDAKWQTASVLVAAAGFLIAAGFWWCYFGAVMDRIKAALADTEGGAGFAGRAGGTRSPGSATRQDLFIYGHLPLTVGVVLAGVSIEQLALDPGRALPAAPGWLLAAGVAGYLIGAAVIVSGSRRTSWRVWAGLAAATAGLAAVAAIPFPDAVVLVLIVGLALVGYAVATTLTSGSRPDSD